jgi:hypothetical protein
VQARREKPIALRFGARVRVLSSGWTVQLDYFVRPFVKARKLLIVGIMGIAEIDLTWVRRCRVRAMQYKGYIRIPSRIFELHYRVRNICQLPRMRKQNVTIAGPSHKMRPSSPARLYKPTMPLTVEIREIGKELQLAGLELCR